MKKVECFVDQTYLVPFDRLAGPFCTCALFPGNEYGRTCAGEEAENLLSCFSFLPFLELVCLLFSLLSFFITCVVYLPAGWFHEVVSFSASPRASSSSPRAASGTEDFSSFHMALNYWMHPPVFGSSFEFPYVDDYWRCRTQPLLAAHHSLVYTCSSWGRFRTFFN